MGFFEKRYEKIDILGKKSFKKYKKEICTFEVSKLAKENGITNTHLSPVCYDENGQLNDGEWLVEITGFVCFPAICYIMAGQKILEDLGKRAMTEFNFYRKENTYFIEFKDETEQSENIIDVMIKTWIKHKLH